MLSMLVHTRQPRLFRKRDILLLKLVAYQAAIAWNAARQFEASQKSNNALRALLEASRVITDANRGLQEGQILEQLLQQAVQCVGRPVLLATILRHDEISGELVFECIHPREELANLMETAPEGVFKIRIGERWGLSDSNRIGVTGRAALTRASCLVPEVQTDSDYLRFHPDTLAEVSVPLVDGERTLAVLNLESKERGAFDKTDVRVLNALAESAVIAIQNTRGLVELDRLNNAAERLSSSSILGDVMQTVAESARQMFQADFASLWLYDPNLGKFIPYQFASDNLPEDEIELIKREVPQPGGISYTILAEERLMVTDIDSLEFCGRQPVRDWLKGIGVRSFQGFLLRQGSDAVGVLYVSYKRPRWFSECSQAQNQFLTLAALALKRALLVDQVNKGQRSR